MVATTPSQKPYVPWYRRWDLPTLLPGVILALVMVWSVVQSIANANWANGLDILVSIALPGLIVGVIFARMVWLPGWLAHLLSAALGIAWMIQRSGALLAAEIATDFGPAQAARLVDWGDRATELLIRFIALTRIVQAGGRGEDIVLFVVALALLIWALAYTSAWMLFRNGWTWWVVVLNAMTILVNYTFALPKPNTLFFVFLAAALLLIVHQHVVRQQQTWQSALMDYPEFISWRFLAAATLFCSGIVLITSILPGQVSVAQAARTWQVISSPLTAAREGWEVAFSTINAPPGTSGSGFTSRAVRVGGGRALGDGIVMRVRSSAYDYWRAVAFDNYNGRGWQNTVGERARSLIGAATIEQARAPIEAGVRVPLADLRGRELVTQTVELSLERSDNLLVTGGQFVSAGIPVQVQHGYTTGGDQPLPNFTETSAVYSEVPLRSEQSYIVTALISTADQQSLRNAGVDYPAWVTDHYLSLPESVTPRTREQARAIVEEAGATNPYDQAIAIENYLRTFQYDETRAAPPTDRDWVDYFLFDARSGYCDDFATSMVVLLRSLDIPARWVQGYAGGTLDPETGFYIVRESIAHSWPEVYFPGYGWQRFEPTPASYARRPARPALPDDSDSLSSTDVFTGGVGPSGNDFLDLEEEFMRQSGGDPERFRELFEAQQRAEQQRRLALLGAVIVALLGAVGGCIFWMRRQERGLTPAATIFLRMGRLGGWSGVPQQPHTTPREYARELGQALPREQDTIERIASTYTAERYGGTARADQDALAQDWQRLRRPLLTRLFTRFSETPPDQARKRRRRK
jgi:hypothetical protein